MAERFLPSGFWSARTGALVAVVLLIGLSLAVLSTAPSVDNRNRPTADDIAAARNIIQQVKSSQGLGAPLRLHLEARQIGAMAVLAGEASGFRRMEAEVSADVFSARASLPLVGGLWINTAATVAGTHDGFPVVHLKVGRVALPAIASRWSADFIRWLLLRNGVELPPLDEVVRHFSVSDGAVTAELALPQHTGLVERLVGAAGVSVDDRLVEQIYCGLGRAQDEGASPRLSALVQQAFHGASGSDPVNYNRAAFVALAFYVVQDQAHPLAQAAADRIRNCARPAENVILRERTDLAKHWAFSAALTAVLGEQMATSLGEWKELHDSLPSGSGFSFVDLAADRSGLHVARMALDPRTASTTARFLSTVSDNDLLPDVLARAPEGLSDVEFVGRFGSLDERRYRDAVSRIDRQLGHWSR